MGRTVPSFRIALHLEQKQWSKFRSSLDKKTKSAFDGVFFIARLYISASMMACRPIRLQPIMMSMVFHHYKELQQLMQEGFESEYIST